MHLNPSPADAASALPPALLTPAAHVSAPPSAVILFGRDEQGRPHASRFDGNNVAEVEAAARLMGLHFAAADTAALRDLATRLPAGRLFPSGKGFVPFVKADLYIQLLAAMGERGPCETFEVRFSCSREDCSLEVRVTFDVKDVPTLDVVPRAMGEMRRAFAALAEQSAGWGGSTPAA